MPALEANATIVRHEQLPGCLFRLWVKPDWDASTKEWEPGQFLRFGVPTGEPTDKKYLRALSLIGLQDGVLELYLVAVEGGTTSPLLSALREGDRCYAEEKITGHFTPAHLPSDKSGDLWMIGTGAGLAPFICMLRHDAELLSRYETVVVVHTVRIGDYLSFGAEMLRRAAADPKLRYIPVVTRSEKPLEIRDGHCALRERIVPLLESGRLEQAAGVTLSPEGSMLMLCGNPQMIKDVTEQLLTRGLSKHRKRTPGNIVSERYW
jgi:ferredoxin--NADP+ reductase